MKDEKMENSKSLILLQYAFAAHRNQCDGKLTGLMEIYKSLGEPKGISPFDVFDHPENRMAINAFQLKYPEQYVIEYRDDDILVNYPLFKIYLNLFDDGNHDEESVWLEILAMYQEKHNNHSEFNRILQDFYSDMGIDHQAFHKFNEKISVAESEYNVESLESIDLYPCPFWLEE